MHFNEKDDFAYRIKKTLSIMVGSHSDRSIRLAVHIVFTFRKQNTMNTMSLPHMFLSGTSHIRISVLETLETIGLLQMSLYFD